MTVRELNAASNYSLMLMLLSDLNFDFLALRFQDKARSLYWKIEHIFVYLHHKGRLDFSGLVFKELNSLKLTVMHFILINAV